LLIVEVTIMLSDAKIKSLKIIEYIVEAIENEKKRDFLESRD